MGELTELIYLPLNEDIQLTFTSFKDHRVITCVDYFPQEGYGQCHIYSCPYTLTDYDNITNNFSGGLFNSVRKITLFDERPFEHEFFIQISQSFPFLEELTIFNSEPQQFKQEQESNSGNRKFSIIKYSHLTKLKLVRVHDDYAEQFLFDTKTCLSNYIRLSIDYDRLQRVTHSVGSIGVDQVSSHGTILSNGVSPSVVENLHALQSIFVDSLSTVHPNVQRNLEQILQINQQQPQFENLQYCPPSLLVTYSSTNSGGSNNGNNNRSTTSFSGVTQNSTIDINLNGLFQASLIRRMEQSMQVRAKFGSLGGPQECQFNVPHGFCLGIHEEVIVANKNNHQIQIFDKNDQYKYQFGMPKKEEGQLWYPKKVAIYYKKISIRYIDSVASLAITQQGNILAIDSVSPTFFCINDVIIDDSHGNRFHIAVFTRTSDFLQEFHCPYVKVSRCCELKITSDGFIVTLTKNNHDALVLNSLYLT
ncbi:unnamed protein product [Rotaria sordida]|uniref:Uncharacterized protein n=1 Tax=Rotaria sordida TaxID=392033 RepID=A0A814N581_9BILA|nr:unnamed protein product [Rotaria sordida]CAF3850103.1 unnamed protein product [Rotaria sordida]